MKGRNLWFASALCAIIATVVAVTGAQTPVINGSSASTVATLVAPDTNVTYYLDLLANNSATNQTPQSNHSLYYNPGSNSGLTVDAAQTSSAGVGTIQINGGATANNARLRLLIGGTNKYTVGWQGSTFAGFSIADDVNSKFPFELTPNAPTASMLLNASGITSLKGVGNSTGATIAAGAGAGTSPTIACATSHVCSANNGTITLTEGTSPPASGVLLTITDAITHTNQPDCIARITLTASPFTEFTTHQFTYTTTVWSINIGAALTASTGYTITYSCMGV